MNSNFLRRICQIKFLFVLFPTAKCHKVWRKQGGGGRSPFLPLAAAPAPAFHRALADDAASLLHFTHGALPGPKVKYPSLHTSLLVCVQNSGIAHIGLEELFQRGNEARASYPQCGGEENTPPPPQQEAHQSVYGWSYV